MHFYFALLVHFTFALNNNITFNENWSALVGVNYATIDNKSYEADGSISAKYDETKATPTLSLIYKPIEDLTTYATYMEALEDGETVSNSYDNEGEIFKPLKSTQYEVGAKWSVNQNLLLSTALFRIEKPNFMDIVTNGAKGKKRTQDGEQVNEGVEILLTGKITDDLTLMGGFTYIEPKIEKNTDKNLEGKYSTNVAKYQAKMWAEYRLPVEAKIFLNGGVYYSGTKYTDNMNTYKIPAYIIADLGARYETKLDGLDTTFRIYASNITDEDYWVNSRFLGDPRIVGFSATLKF